MVVCRLAVRPQTNIGIHGSLLGLRPPVNEPIIQRMSGPLLQAPYELLPAPSSVDRRDRPLLPSSPPRSLMHRQSADGFRREVSPPRSVAAFSAVSDCLLVVMHSIWSVTVYVLTVVTAFRKISFASNCVCYGIRHTPAS